MMRQAISDILARHEDNMVVHWVDESLVTARFEDGRCWRWTWASQEWMPEPPLERQEGA